MNKNSSCLNFGKIFGGLIIFALLGIALFAVVIHEVNSERTVFVNNPLQGFTFLNKWQENTGNEFSGEAAAWVFGAACLPVAIELVLRAVVRYMHVVEKRKEFIRQLIIKLRKYLMPFHTYLSIFALAFGLLHLRLSSCVANPFPEWGLLLSGILVGTGLLAKWKVIPAKYQRLLYRFHASLIVTALLFTILFVGHMIMSID
jgi:hypothetical protein